MGDHSFLDRPGPYVEDEEQGLHVVYPIMADIEWGHFDSVLAMLERAVKERRKTILYAAVTGTNV